VREQHIVQPLHIFEPRYRAMTRDALAGDRLIALVLLKPGWEQDYEGRPAVYEVACLGRIIQEQRLPDGKFNLALQGLCRLRLEGEVEDDKPYRTARARPLPDPDDDPPELHRLLRETVGAWFASLGILGGHFEALVKTPQPVGALCDLLAYTLPLALEVKQALLEECDVEQRVRRLVHELQITPTPELPTGPRRPYPPEFSPN
jgi:Lon protease-like protein